MNLRNRFGVKASAAVIAVGGLGLGLIGSGVHAAFTDSGTATENISVGSFGCAVSSTTPGVVLNGKNVSLTVGPLVSSTAGTAPFVFKVASTGTIPVKVSVTQTSPAAPFTSMLAAPVADVTLTGSGTSNLYAAGLQWPELVLADSAKTTSITYAVSCTEVSAPKFSTLTGTAGHVSDQYGTWATDNPPVVDLAASTITWTIPIATAASPMTSQIMSSPILASPQGRFAAVPVTGNVSILASMSLSSGLTAEAAKFQGVYRSTVVYGPYASLTAAGPFTGLNLATTHWAGGVGGHMTTDNGLGVSWAGVTGTGTVTIVLAFSAN